MNDGRRLGRRCVLRDSVTAEDVMDYAENSGWLPIGHIAADPAQGVHFELLWSVGPEVTAHYVEDGFAHVRYVTATGSDLVRIEATAARIERQLQAWTVDELSGQLDRAELAQDRAAAVVRLGMAAPLTAIPAVIDRLKAATRDSDHSVRHAAVWAMIYTAWPRFRPVLAGLVDDPALDVAGVSAAALRALDDEDFDETAGARQSPGVGL